MAVQSNDCSNKFPQTSLIFMCMVRAHTTVTLHSAPLYIMELITTKSFIVQVAGVFYITYSSSLAQELNNLE
jgi:hypothetical protein